jgi:ribosomal protein L35
VTATGKVKHRKCGTSHLAIAKSAKKIRHLRGTRVLEPAYTRAVVDALRGNSY